MLDALTEKQFNRDIATHQIDVLRDDGVYRHVRCRRPGTGCMGFDIVTWPGYLAYSGDMGDYMFTRLNDMFDFFRNSWGRINPGYWAEKCVAADKSDGISEFNVDTFRSAIIDSAKLDLELDDDDELPEDALDELRELLEVEDEWDCVSRVRDFDSERFDFTDFFENDCDEYTSRFIWCLRAIVWAIDKYDERTSAK